MVSMLATMIGRKTLYEDVRNAQGRGYPTTGPCAGGVGDVLGLKQGEHARQDLGHNHCYADRISSSAALVIGRMGLPRV